MIFGSVCSGIEAASVAWHPLGWRTSFVSEIDKFPRAVLSHHFPTTPLHGDFTTIQDGDYEPISVLVGGTPCQSFSVAGLRGGLGDDRGNLALEYLRLAARLRPRWLVWENVPGVLSSNGGRDFGSVLGGLVQLGYGFSYRVLDAQFFNLAQRRERVFVVGYLGDWRRAAAVLFERASLRGDTAPRREKGKRVADTLTVGANQCSGFKSDVTEVIGPLGAAARFGQDEAAAGHLIASTGETSHCLNAGDMGRQDYETETLIAHTLRGNGFDASEDGTGRGTPIVLTMRSNGDAHSGFRDEHGLVPTFAIQERVVSENPNAGPQGKGWQERCAFTMEARNKVQAVAFAQNTRDELREMNVVGALASNPGMKQTSYLRLQSAVRRLTPTECERLQGFPDGWTDVPYRGKQAADGPRYKAIGNSMAVPVMHWIGKRIALVDGLP